MKTPTHFSSKRRFKPASRRQRGIALVTTLLLLLLLTAMSLTMVLSVGSDLLVNGYYGNDRASFYAADSGANIARQAITTAILAAVPGTFSATVQPIPAGTNATVQATVYGSYSAPTPLNGGPAGSWPEKFAITSLTLSAPTCTVVGGPALNPTNNQPVTCLNLPPAGTSPAVTGFNYIYPYQLTSVGQSQGAEATTLVDSGNLIFSGTIAAAGATTVSFASYGTFIDQYPPCSAPFVAGNLYGPFFTNGAWNFGDANALGSATKYDFQNTTGQAAGAASYWHGNNCVNASAASNTADGTTIAPTFQAGLNLGVPSVQLPQNDFNQKQAVLDGIGNASSNPTPAYMGTILENAAGQPYDNAKDGTLPSSSGVYLPYSTNSKGQSVLNGGGIYVEGNAAVTLSPSGTTGQVYSIVQNGVTTTVVTNPTGIGTGTTTIQVGNGAVTTISGVPTILNSSGGPPVENATMLYVDGNIASLSGPGEYQPAINNGVALTITAASNVTVTGDIRYETEPVVTSGSSPPLDTLIPANNTGQVLGIFTATGNIQMNNSQRDGNLEIDASIAMISQGGTGGWVNIGPQINTLNLVGGRIANQALNGNTITRNIFFDQRFSQGGFAPPWYPSTTVQASGTDTSAFTPPTVQRLQWYYKSSYQ